MATGHTEGLNRQGVIDLVMFKVYRNVSAVMQSSYCMHCGEEWSDRRPFCNPECAALFHLVWSSRHGAALKHQ